MKLILRINVLMVIAASSYVTLGVANSDAARELWWVYGLLSFVLAVWNLMLERRLLR